MSSNFEFLRSDWKHLLTDATEVEQSAYVAPRTAVFYARRTLERAVKWMYMNDRDLKPPYQNNLAALIHEQTFKDTLAPGLFDKARVIHKLGNLAVHSEKPISRYDGLQVTRCLHAFLSFIAKIYSETPPAVAPFDETLIPQKSTPKTINRKTVDKNAAQLAALADNLREKDKALDKEQQEKNRLQAGYDREITELKTQIAGFKTANSQTVHDEDYSEEETRDLFIDLLLREAGWDPHGSNVAEYEVTGMPNKQGQGYVDYVLWGDDGKPLALVEAKRTKKSPKVGQQQAKLYADCLEQMAGQRPLIFYSNGFETWLWDDSLYPPGTGTLRCRYGPQGPDGDGDRFRQNPHGRGSGRDSAEGQLGAQRPVFGRPQRSGTSGQGGFQQSPAPCIAGQPGRGEGGR